jgi:hypothetical protein
MALPLCIISKLAKGLEAGVEARQFDQRADLPVLAPAHGV